MSAPDPDPDARDWRLSGEVRSGGDGAALGAVVGRLTEARAARDAEHAVGADVVVTHDGARLFAYAPSRQAIEQARGAIEQALAADGLAAGLELSCWSEEHEEWVDPDAPPAARAAESPGADAVETRTYAVKLGRWVRAEFEQSLRGWADRLGLECEVVEHPHLLSTQAAFTVTGPRRELDEFAAAMKAEEWATIRTETAVMSSPL